MNILLIDDHPLFCDGLKGILVELDRSPVIRVVGSCEEALELVQSLDEIDLLLLDLNLPGMNGLEGMQQIRHQMPATPIVILSASEDRDKVLRAIELGAKGYIPKSSSSEIILNALRLVLSGGVYLPMAALDTVNTHHVTVSKDEQTLTPRQLAVLKLLANGHTNKAIGKILDMAENTVRVHVSAILHVLDVTNRTEASVAARRLGVLIDDSI